MPDNSHTDFGFQQVPTNEKTSHVEKVFASVASKYDVMNDLMSFGMHRLWKNFTIAAGNVKVNQKILDIAGGTGDLTKKFVDKVGPQGLVVLADINEKMLEVGRERLINDGIMGPVKYVQANAEALPFPDNYFDCISIAFGLRNVTDKARALSSMYRVLKPGGKLLVLEFSKPVLPWLNKLYDLYSFNVIPKLGEWICKDAPSYQYLVESIRMHPDQKTLQELMLTSGFDEVNFHNLTSGIVALHKGYKY